jgi:hypothetical protein
MYRESQAVGLLTVCGYDINTTSTGFIPNVVFDAFVNGIEIGASLGFLGCIQLFAYLLSIRLFG